MSNNSYKKRNGIVDPTLEIIKEQKHNSKVNSICQKLVAKITEEYISKSKVSQLFIRDCWKDWTSWENELEDNK